MQSLSAKNYIQKRARILPIYKCFVIKNWQESKFVGVIVMRKHTNGNITAGFYFVDLYCLGVKSTRYFFNVDEKELLENFPDIDTMYEEVDYTVAHNIVFAGHDFAMEFEIGPAKEFELTRFILEEDNDNIPLIEIEVGDKGVPHLVVIKSNERPDALAKLKKNAGEGNYYYSVAEEQNFDEYFLDNIPIGRLDCLKVLKVETEDLEDDEKVDKRNEIERIYINAELFTRYLTAEEQQIEKKIYQAWLEKWSVELSDVLTDPIREFFDEYEQAFDEILSNKTGSLVEDAMIRAVSKYPDNPIVVSLVYEQSILLESGKAYPVAKEYAEKLMDKYPMVKVSLALGALVLETKDDRFDAIYKAESIGEIYPGETIYFRPQFANFALIKMLQCIEAGDIAFSRKYYYMIANNGGDKCAFTFYVFEKYGNLLMDRYDDDAEEEAEEKKG